MTEGRLSRYRIDKLLGEGAIGKVHLATDLELERPVALKLIQITSAKLTNREEVRARFQREAKLTARLQHPNIVVVYEFGEDQNSLFLAMEYVPGGTLAQRLAPGSVPFPLDERIVLAAEIAEAIAHAHERGVLHRDLKPANILLTAEGDAKVSDFGIGKLLSGDVDLTDTGEMIGSPAYMSPEQMRGERLDAKSDIFGLGVVLFHLLTGKKPFDATNLPALVSQIKNDSPPDPFAIEPELPPEVGRILLRCLAKRKEDRYPDAGSLARDLRSLVPVSGDAAAGLSSMSLRRILSDTSGKAKRLPSESSPRPDTTSVPTHVSGERAYEQVPTIHTGQRVSRGRYIPWAVAGAFFLIAALAVWLRRSPTESLAVRRARRPQATAVPVPTPAPTPVPTPDPSSAFLRDAHESWPYPAALSIHAVARHGLALHVVPGTARVFLDGKYAGVADDWSGQGSGSVLAFSRAWRHVLRVVHPGHGDLEIDFIVNKGSREDVAVVTESMPPGTSSAPATLPPEERRPDAKTSGAVRFDVVPRDAAVTVNGAGVGPASRFAGEDLILDGPAVHELTITAEGREPVRLRVLVSPAVKVPRATIRKKI